MVSGATGQIGSMLVDNLLKGDKSVRAVIRNSSKAQELKREDLKSLLQIVLM
jgi:uncharacterized protein YbjT (DUF2867 family)